MAEEEATPGLTQQEFNVRLVESLDKELKTASQQRAQLQNELNQIKQQQGQFAQNNGQIPLPADADERMLAEIRENPVRYTQNLMNVAKQEATKAIEEKLQQKQAQEAKEEQTRNWWSEVWQHNPDVADMQHQVVGYFNQTDKNLDPSERVNWAITQVRNQIQNRINFTKEQEAQQEAQKRMASSGMMNVPWMNGATQEQGEGIMNPKEILDDFVSSSNQRMQEAASAAEKRSLPPKEHLGG